MTRMERDPENQMWAGDGGFPSRIPQRGWNENRELSPSSPPAEHLDSAFTLLELVTAISEVTDDNEEINATVFHLLQSGRVRLRGTTRPEASVNVMSSVRSA